MMEVARLSNIVCLSIAHSPVRDTTLDGYFIPEVGREGEWRIQGVLTARLFLFACQDENYNGYAFSGTLNAPRVLFVRFRGPLTPPPPSKFPGSAPERDIWIQQVVLIVVVTTTVRPFQDSRGLFLKRRLNLQAHCFGNTSLELVDKSSYNHVYTHCC